MLLVLTLAPTRQTYHISVLFSTSDLTHTRNIDFNYVRQNVKMKECKQVV